MIFRCYVRQGLVETTYGISIYIYIQGVSRLNVMTAGGDFLGRCDENIHINMCPILDGCGVMDDFRSRTRPGVNRARNQLREVVHTTCGLIALSADLTTQQKAVQFPYVSTLGRNALQGAVGGYSPGQLYCNTQLLIRVQNPLSHYSDCSVSHHVENSTATVQ
jgi:hypothetical protein